MLQLCVNQMATQGGTREVPSGRQMGTRREVGLPNGSGSFHVKSEQRGGTWHPSSGCELTSHEWRLPYALNLSTWDVLSIRGQKNLMAGHRCLIILCFSRKVRVDVKNGQLKAIEAMFRISQRLVHALLFEVGLFIYFQWLTTTKPITKEAPVYSGHRCPAIRFSWIWQ